MNKLIFLISLIYSFSTIGSEDHYRFDPHHGEYSAELNNYFTPVFNEGRMQIYRLNKGVRHLELPEELFTHLVKIRKGDWKVIKPKELQQALIPSP